MFKNGIAEEVECILVLMPHTTICLVNTHFFEGVMMKISYITLPGVLWRNARKSTGNSQTFDSQYLFHGCGDG